MVENEAGSPEAEESRDNPSSGVTPKGVSESAALLDSDEVQSSASLNKSFGSGRKRPRLDLLAESTAKKDIINAAEAEVPEAPMLHPAGSPSDQTPSHKSTAAETNLMSSFPDRDPLASLPVELLGEILIYTRSTKDVLRVARCSKHLWKTLTEPSSAFIWKKTRRIALPKPMPNPPSVLSEYAYALMVYGGGKCEVSGMTISRSTVQLKLYFDQICLNYTNEMYFSFTFKFRVCRDVSFLQPPASRHLNAELFAYCRKPAGRLTPPASKLPTLSPLLRVLRRTFYCTVGLPGCKETELRTL